MIVIQSTGLPPQNRYTSPELKRTDLTFRKRQKEQQAKNAVQFSGHATMKHLTDKLVPVFKNINEVFLLGFLAQDVFAMWVPRITTSLKTGRIPYNPKNDPDHQDSSPVHRFAHQIKENWNGLNWINFEEETKREVVTGPALMLLPSLIFAGNRYYGNQSRELSYPVLKQLGAGFSSHLESHSKTTKPLTKELYKTWVASYLNQVFIDPGLQNQSKEALEIKKLTNQYANLLLNKANLPPGKKFGKLSQIFKPQSLSPIERVSQNLQQVISTLNQKSRLQPYSHLNGNKAFSDKKPLTQRGKTWIHYNPSEFHKTASGHSQQSLETITQNIEKMGDYFHEVWKTVEKDGNKAQLSDIAEHTIKKLVVGKHRLGLFTTALSSVYLFLLVFWTQRNKVYEATRLLNDDPAVTAPKTQHTPAGNVPSPSIAPFSSPFKFDGERSLSGQFPGVPLAALSSSSQVIRRHQASVIAKPQQQKEGYY